MVTRARRAMAAVAGAVPMLLAGCGRGGATPVGRACQLAPQALVARAVGEAVPSGERRRNPADEGRAAGCAYDLGGGRAVVVWVRDVGGAGAYRDEVTSLQRTFDTTAITGAHIEGVRLSGGPRGRPGTWLLVGGRTFVQVQMWDEGPDATITQTMADQLALDIAATILGKPASATTTLR